MMTHIPCLGCHSERRCRHSQRSEESPEGSAFSAWRFLASVGMTVVAALSFLASVAAASVDVKSPDGRLNISFRTVATTQPAPGEKLVYSVSFKDKPLIEE